MVLKGCTAGVPQPVFPVFGCHVSASSTHHVLRLRVYACLSVEEVVFRALWTPHSVSAFGRQMLCRDVNAIILGPYAFVNSAPAEHCHTDFRFFFAAMYCHTHEFCSGKAFTITPISVCPRSSPCMAARTSSKSLLMRSLVVNAPQNGIHCSLLSR